MAKDDTQYIDVENLLLASLLIVGGGKLVSIESGPRLSVVRISVVNLDTSRLGSSFDSLNEDMANMPDCSAKAWNWLFDSSVLGTIESEYRRLKRLVVTQRSRRDS